MKIILANPLALSNQGKRPNNEDNLFPLAGNAKANQDDLFVVCDGVGGSNKGEVASKIVSESFHRLTGKYKIREKLKQAKNQEEIDNIFADLLKEVEIRLDNKIRENLDTRGMASTLTYLLLTEKGAIVAWVGDSRVYQFRNGKVLNKTQDHSLVAQLVESGQITAEEALKHPKKNVILRAITGGENPTKADTLLWTDVQKGDSFLLCTDGILEGFDSDQELAALFDGRNSTETAKQIIKNCTEKSKDNFTMYLLTVDKVLTETRPQAVEQTFDPEPVTYAEPKNYASSERQAEKGSKKFVLDSKTVLLVAAVIIFLAVAGVAIYALRDVFVQGKESTEKTPEQRKIDSLEKVLKGKEVEENRRKAQPLPKPTPDPKPPVNVNDDNKDKKEKDGKKEKSGFGYIDDVIKDKKDDAIKGAQDLIGGNNDVDKSKTHKVTSGETIFKIAQQYGISEAELMKENNLQDSIITAGQTLKIPVKK